MNEKKAPSIVERIQYLHASKRVFDQMHLRRNETIVFVINTKLTKLSPERTFSNNEFFIIFFFFYINSHNYFRCKYVN